MNISISTCSFKRLAHFPAQQTYKNESVAVDEATLLLLLLFHLYIYNKYICININTRREREKGKFKRKKMLKKRISITNFHI